MAEVCPIIKDERMGMLDLKERRKSMGLSQAGLAKLCGCSRGYVSQIENGMAMPNASMRRTINEALAGKITVADIEAERISRAYCIVEIAFKDEAERKEFHEYWCDRYSGNPKM